MEKNWIEKIKKAIRIAMNKGLDINVIDKTFYIYPEEAAKVIILDITPTKIIIKTSKGLFTVSHSLTDREKLEIQALILSIKEYREDMAISEFEEFISNKSSKPMDVNDLDDKEDE